jgi:hypothetical protein
MKLELPVGRLLLRLMPHDKPVTMDRIRLLRKLSIGTDALFPANGRKPAAAETLRNSFLAKFLAGREMGVWTLDAATLNFLEAEIQAQPPRTILEFGSGVSTVCLARYVSESFQNAPESRRHSSSIISIDQSQKAASATREMLMDAGIMAGVRFFHAPLEPRMIEGRVMNCYALPESAIQSIAEARPNFVLIDGPFAEPGARFGTMPLVREYLAPGTRFYLDDALRDGEIDAAILWKRLLPGVSLKGILPTDKGLLVGCVT